MSFILVLSLLFSVFLLPMLGLNVIGLHNALTIMCFVCYIACVSLWNSKGNRKLSLYNLFIIYSLFSNLGQSLLYVLNVPVDILSLYAQSSMDSINQMLKFQILCIIGIYMGTHIYLKKRSHVVSIQQMTEMYKTSNIKLPRTNKYILDTLLIISAITILSFAFRMFVLRQNVDYGTFYQEKSSWGNILTDILHVLYAVLAIYYVFRKRFVIPIHILNLFFVFIFMVIGARSIALPYMGLLIVTLPVAFPKLFRKRYAIIWIVGALFFFASLSVISSTRTSTIGSTTFSFQNGLLFSIYDTISEMGMSARTITLTMEAVDYGFPHRQTILSTIVNAFIPFVSEISFIKEHTMVCSTWISNYAHSFNAGLGYSFVAEMYLNFGWLGCIFMVLYGYFLAFAENYSYKNIFNRRNLLAISLLVFLCQQIFFARGEFYIVGGTIRILFYFSIIAYIFRNLSKS